MRQVKDDQNSMFIISRDAPPAPALDHNHIGFSGRSRHVLLVLLGQTRVRVYKNRLEAPRHGAAVKDALNLITTEIWDLLVDKNGPNFSPPGVPFSNGEDFESDAALALHGRRSM